MGQPEQKASAVYTPKEFALRIRRSVRTLQRWAAKGILKPARYPSGRPYYTDLHIDQLPSRPEAS